jgi:hypothetical protein
MDIEQTLEDIEAFYRAAKQLPGFRGSGEEVEAASDEQLGELEQKYQLTLPDDVRRLLKRGLKFFQLSAKFDDGKQVSLAFDWLDVAGVDRQTALLRELAQHAEGSSKRLMEHGIALSYSPPQIVVDPTGAIFHFHASNDLQPPVAPSLGKFLELWLEAGCFSSHALNAYLPRVKHLLPGHVAEVDNAWIQYYRRAFAEYV